MALTMVNPPMGVGNDSSIASMAAGSVTLGTGAVAGTVAGAAISNRISKFLPADFLGGYGGPILAVVVQSAAALGIGAVARMAGSERSTSFENVRVGLQGSMIATSLLPLLDKLTGGMLIKAMMPPVGNQYLQPPVGGGYNPSDFGGQGAAMSSLQATVGAAYGWNLPGGNIAVGMSIPPQFSPGQISRGPVSGVSPDSPEFYA